MSEVFCFRKRPGSAAEIHSSNPNAVAKEDRARCFAPHRAYADSRACPACQGLPYQGSCLRSRLRGSDRESQQ